MKYAEFVARTGEVNKPSGGLQTILRALSKVNLTEKSKVLDIGCNTGFTSFSIGLHSEASVVGIDTSQEAIDHATMRKSESAEFDKVEFQLASGIDIPFVDNSFDVVWISNTASFVSDKEKFFSESFRVAKPGGFLVFVPIYYLMSPPKRLVNEISQIIGTTIDVTTRGGWLDLISRNCRSVEWKSEMVWESVGTYDDVEEAIGPFVEKLASTSKSPFDRSYARRIYNLFNSNLRLCGFSLMLITKTKTYDQPELFTTSFLESDV